MHKHESTPRDPHHIPDLLLERYLLNELPADQKQRLDENLAHDPVLKTRLEALRASTEAFAHTHNAAVLAHGVKERLRREAVEADIRSAAVTTSRRGTDVAGFKGWKPVLGSAFLLALAAIPAWQVLDGTSNTLVTTSSVEDVTTKTTTRDVDDPSTQVGAPTRENPTDKPLPSETSRPLVPMASNTAKPSIVSTDHIDAEASEVEAETQHDTRLKGISPALALFRRTPAGAEPLQPGSTVKPGDVIRIGYRAGGKSFGAIFSVDGNGNVTRHWPVKGEQAAALERGEALLPAAFELDAAPDYERFFLVSAERAFDLKPVLESLHAGKNPGFPGMTVARFDLIKDNGL